MPLGYGDVNPEHVSHRGDYAPPLLWVAGFGLLPSAAEPKELGRAIRNIGIIEFRVDKDLSGVRYDVVGPITLVGWIPKRIGS